MKKIGIIINPHAKKNRKMRENPVDLYRRIGGDHVEVRATGSLDEVFTVAEEFKSMGISYLGVCGGDGTLHHVLSRFIQVYRKEELPALLILKGGTMDTISRSINLKGKGPEILTRLISLISEGREVTLFTRDTMKVGDKYGFLFGLGITSNFLVDYYRGGDTGTWKAIKVAAAGIFKGIFLSNAGLFKRLNAVVTIDGKEVPCRDFLGILAATVESVGIGFRPLYRAYEKDHTFHVIATGMKPFNVVLQVWKLKNGKPLCDPRHFDTIASVLEVKGPRQFQYMMDGDLYQATDSLKLEAGPRVRLVYV
jgi:diacylglycerol kinase family enzyme